MKSLGLIRSYPAEQDIVISLHLLALTTAKVQLQLTIIKIIYIVSIDINTSDSFGYKDQEDQSLSGDTKAMLEEN